MSNNNNELYTNEEVLEMFKDVKEDPKVEATKLGCLFAGCLGIWGMFLFTLWFISWVF